MCWGLRVEKEWYSNELDGDAGTETRLLLLVRKAGLLLFLVNATEPNQEKEKESRCKERPRERRDESNEERYDGV